MKGLLRGLRRWLLRPTDNAIERQALELGRLQARLLAQTAKTAREAEFGVFSQHNEDGIIQWLLAQVTVRNRSFVEFGVQDYRESNTRFLLMKDRWQGWIIDAGMDHQRYVQEQSYLGQEYGVQALQAFITQENIEGLLQEAGVPEELGLLSVDIDGNDYWVLKAIERVKPAILVLEYNAFFGPELSLTIPYDARFQWSSGSASAYFGASLTALTTLAGRKGYALVACDSAGVNAFFVRRDLLGALPELSVADAFVARSQGSQLQSVRERPLQDPDSGRVALIAEWFGLGVARG